MITESDIKQLLKEKIAILIKGVLEKMPIPPQAIYLVGGYGRGEGAWFEDDKGIHPYNDFDLAVIIDKPLSHKDTELLRKELAKAVDIKWVDIDYYSLDSLRRMNPTIHNVDLFEGSSLIYGEDVIKNNNLHLDSREIGKEDLITLYWTRMWTFLGSWEGPFHKLDAKEALFFKNQMAKAILAACDMRLVKQHLYTTSYRERVNRVLNEFTLNKEFCKLTEWAVEEKMRPSSTKLEKEEMKSLYFRVKREFISAFEYAFGKNSGLFLCPYRTKGYYLLHTRSYLIHLYAILRYHNSNVVRRLDVFYAMNYVFHANKDDVIDSHMLKKASRLLMKHGFIKEPNSSWDEMRMLVANARNNI